jgi:uncharacterized protein (TIGR02246 family)
MKRILVVTLLIAAAASLVVAWAARPGATTTQDAIIANEKQIIEALKKKDAAAFKNLIAPDAMLLGSQGRLAMADFNKVVFGPDYTLVSATVEDPQVKMIDQDAAILTYKSTGTETFKGKTETGTSYASSIWTKHGDKWVAVFHQESLVAPPQTGGEEKK